MRPWIGAQRIQVGAYGRLLAYSDQWEGPLEVETSDALLSRLQGREMEMPAFEQRVQARRPGRVDAGELEVNTK